MNILKMAWSRRSSRLVPHQVVVLGVGDLRAVEDVVAIVVVGDLGAQLLDSELGGLVRAVLGHGGALLSTGLVALPSIASGPRWRGMLREAGRRPGQSIARPVLGGLRHEYEWIAA